MKQLYLIMFVFLLFSIPFALAQTDDVCSGCENEKGECYTVGEQQTVMSSLAYCKADQHWYPVKEDGKTCSENYQCKSNYCIEGLCDQLPKESFIKRFFSWLWDAMFG